MDKDIAVLIIHALIKQLGMHGAGPRHGERRVKADWWRCRGGGSERETADGKELRGPTDKESVKQRRGLKSGGGRRIGICCYGFFSASRDSWAVNMQSLMAIRQSE